MDTPTEDTVNKIVLRKNIPVPETFFETFILNLPKLEYTPAEKKDKSPPGRMKNYFRKYKKLESKNP